MDEHVLSELSANMKSLVFLLPFWSKISETEFIILLLKAWYI